MGVAQRASARGSGYRYGVILLREALGAELRRRRLDQGRTLRQVSADAKVSLGYLSEIERGEKEASSEMLNAVCGALGAPLSDVLAGVTATVADREGLRVVGPVPAAA